MTQAKPLKIVHLHYALNYLEGLLACSKQFREAIGPLYEKYKIQPITKEQEALLKEAAVVPFGQLKEPKIIAEIAKQRFFDATELAQDQLFVSTLQRFLIPTEYAIGIAEYIGQFGKTNLLKKAIILEHPHIVRDKNSQINNLPEDLVYYNAKIPIGANEKEFKQFWKVFKKASKEAIKKHVQVQNNVELSKSKRDYYEKWSPERFDRAFRMLELEKKNLPFQEAISQLESERVIRGRFDMAREGEINRDIQLMKIQLASLREDRIIRQLTKPA